MSVSAGLQVSCMCAASLCGSDAYTHLLIEKLQSARLTEETTLGSCNCSGDSASQGKKKEKPFCVSVSSFAQRYE